MKMETAHAGTTTASENDLYDHTPGSSVKTQDFGFNFGHSSRSTHQPASIQSL